MKTIKKLAFLFCFTLFLFSCNEDTSLVDNPMEEDEPITEISFTYNGVKYYSECEAIPGQELLNIFDDEVREVVMKLRSMPNLHMVVNGNGEIAYFDTKDEFVKIYNISEIPEEIATKSYYIRDVRFRLHENTNNNKLIVEHDTNGGKNPDLRTISKNNKISSLKIIANWDHVNDGSLSSDATASITLYEQFNYEGLSIRFVMSTRFTPGENHAAAITNLKNYPLEPGSSRNWNDNASSYTCGLISNKLPQPPHPYQFGF